MGLQVTPEKRLPHATLYTAGETLSDGTQIDLVQRNKQIQLLIWSSSDAPTEYAAHYSHTTGHYAPAQLPPGMERRFLWPKGPQESRSPEDLFETLSLSFSTFIENDKALVLAAFVMSSWVWEAFESAPRILIATRNSRRIVSAYLAGLCRRGLHLTNVSSSNYWSLPHQVSPTLIINQVRVPGPLQRLLLDSETRGAFSINRGALVELASPLAIVVQDPNHCLPLVKDIPHLFVEGVGRSQGPSIDFQALQDQLLHFRLTNISRLRSSFAGQTLKDSLADIVGGAAQDRLCAAIEEGEIFSDSSDEIEPERVVLECLLACTHDQLPRKIGPTELTRMANVLGQGRGADLHVSPEQVGRYLQKFGMKRRRNSSGAYYSLDDKASEQIHTLASRTMIQHSPPFACPHCMQSARPENQV